MSFVTNMQTQLQFQWGENRREKSEPVEGSLSGNGDSPGVLARTPARATVGAIVATCGPPPVSTPARSTAPPLFPPLPAAVECGVFGLTEAGPIEPDEEEVASLTAEHANEMRGLLADLAAVEHGLRTGCDPRTGKPPRTPATRERLATRLQAEHVRLQEAYADMLAVYADAFGDAAADALDAWVRNAVGQSPIDE